MNRSSLKIDVGAVKLSPSSRKQNSSPKREKNKYNNVLIQVAILPEHNSEGDLKQEGLFILNGTKKQFRNPFELDIEKIKPKDKSPPNTPSSSRQGTSRKSPKKTPRELKLEAFNEQNYSPNGFSTDPNPIYDFIEFKTETTGTEFKTKEIVIEFPKEVSLEVQETALSNEPIITADNSELLTPKTPDSPNASINSVLTPKTSVYSNPRTPCLAFSPRSSDRASPLSTPRDHKCGLIIGEDFIKNNTRVRVHPQVRNNNYGHLRWYADRQKQSLGIKDASPAVQVNNIRVHEQPSTIGETQISTSSPHVDSLETFREMVLGPIKSISNTRGSFHSEDLSSDNPLQATGKKSRNEKMKKLETDDIFYVRVKQPLLIKLPTPNIHYDKEYVIPFSQKRRAASASISRVSGSTSSFRGNIKSPSSLKSTPITGFASSPLSRNSSPGTPTGSRTKFPFLSRQDDDDDGGDIKLVVGHVSRSSSVASMKSIHTTSKQIKLSTRPMTARARLSSTSILETKGVFIT